MSQKAQILLNIDALRGYLKADIINQPVSAGSNILSEGIKPTHSPALLRIYASFDAQGVLKIAREKGGESVTEDLNSGNALTANCAYMFDILATRDEEVNLQYSVDATCLRLIVVELPVLW